MVAPRAQAEGPAGSLLLPLSRAPWPVGLVTGSLQVAFRSLPCPVLSSFRVREANPPTVTGFCDLSKGRDNASPGLLTVG